MTKKERVMIKEYLELGQIVSTHGIKGEMRFNPWCDTPDFVKKFKTLYFDNKGAPMLLSVLTLSTTTVWQCPSRPAPTAIRTCVSTIPKW